MKVSLIVPTLDEAGCIERVLAEVPPGSVDEILVVDKSTDGTADIVRRLGHRVIEQTGKGFGDAFALGAKHATGDVLVLMDGDGSHNPADIPKLLQKYREGCDYVMACRYFPEAGSLDDTAVRSFGNWMFTKLVNLIHGLAVNDSLYLFTAIDRQLYQSLNVTSKGFEYCIEVLVKAHKAGARIAEVPSQERKRFSGVPKTKAIVHGWPILFEIFKSAPKAAVPYRSDHARSVQTENDQIQKS